MSQNTLTNVNSAGAPIQPSSKGTAAAPKLNSQDMEMGNLPTGDAPPSERISCKLQELGIYRQWRSSLSLRN